MSRLSVSNEYTNKIDSESFLSAGERNEMRKSSKIKKNITKIIRKGSKKGKKQFFIHGSAHATVDWVDTKVH